MNFYTDTLIVDVVAGLSWLLAAGLSAAALAGLLLLPEVLAQLRSRRRNKCEIRWMDILQNGRGQKPRAYYWIDC
jgi:hypothetical protein